MHRYRVPIFLMTVFSVILITWLLIQIGNGYRPNIQDGSVKITGLLVTNSEPKGAQVFINNQVTTATDDTLTLEPGEYLVELKKNGFFPWSKTLKIEQGLVTQTNALLFPSTTDLKSITYTGVFNSTISPNGSRIIYLVNNTESSTSNEIKTESGVWLLELSDLPLRFNRDPQQIVTGLPKDADTQNLELLWSYNSQEFLAILSTKQASESSSLDKKVYRFSINKSGNQFTNQYLVNNPQTVIESWQIQNSFILNNQLTALPTQLYQLLATTSSEFNMSPDETKLLYTATLSAQLSEEYIPKILSSSTQIQNRDLIPNHTYIYDIKEDKNFDITSTLNKLDNPEITWFPSSKHIILSTIDGVNLLEYDNSNLTTIYSGPLSNSKIFPHPSGNRILIETTLNPVANPTPNIYAIILK